MRPDLRTCKALGGAVKLILANRGDIRQVTLSNNQYTSIIKGLPNAIALDYHYERDLLFWSDVSADVIKQSFLNGTNVKDVIKWGLESPGNLTAAPKERKISTFILIESTEILITLLRPR